MRNLAALANRRFAIRSRSNGASFVHSIPPLDARQPHRQSPAPLGQAAIDLGLPPSQPN
jgi:hypothetical protein